MKTKNTILTVMTLATTLLVGAFAHTAQAGDIFDVCAVQDGTGTATGANRCKDAYDANTALWPKGGDKATKAGQKAYFALRLVSRDTTTSTDNAFTLTHIGSGSETVDWLAAPFQIGIFVSGELRYATYETDIQFVDTGYAYTDIIFSYTTKQGDFALPILLAAEDASGNVVAANYKTADLKKYHFSAAGCAKWDYKCLRTDSTVDSANWSVLNEGRPGMTGSKAPIRDISLERAGYNVQTLDFDDNWETEDTLWRSVHADSTITVGTTPRVVQSVAADEAVSIYVWSTNENAVIVTGPNVTKVACDPRRSGVTFNVAKVTLGAGELSSDLTLKGVTDGGESMLVMSAYNCFTKSKTTGEYYEDYIMVPVKCVEALPPSVIVESDTTSAIAGTNELKAAARLTVRLSQPVSQTFSVTITPKRSNCASATDPDWGKYVRLSTDSDTVSVLPDANAVTVTLGGSIESAPVYVFALRGDTDTTGVNKMKFIPTSTDKPASITALNETGFSITSVQPVINEPVEGANAFTATAGEAMPMDIRVDGSYADRADTNTGFKVWYRLTPSEKYVELDGGFYPGEGNILYKLDEKGKVTTDRPSFVWSTVGENTASIYVVAPVSKKDSKIAGVGRSFTVTVEAARESHLETSDGTTTFDEGDLVSFNIWLDEKGNDKNKSLYAFLKPSDNVTNDLSVFEIADRAPFIVGMTNEYGKAKGIEIKKGKGKEETPSTCELYLLDGTSRGLKVDFELVFCESSEYDETKLVSGFDSNTLTIKVNNVVPTIDGITLGTGNNQVTSEESGWDFGRISKGIKQTFTMNVTDPGAYDLTAGEAADPKKVVSNDLFRVEWHILRNNTQQEAPVTYGNPADHPLEYTFNATGKWVIWARVKDKDMSTWNTKNSSDSYRISFEVVKQPTLTVVADPVLYETDTKKTPRPVVTVGLGGIYDSEEDVIVKLEVVSKAAAGKDKGYLHLATNYLYFSDNAEQTVKIDDLDGTLDSTFYIKATVANPKTDGVTYLPTGQHVSEYYLPGTSDDIDVRNVDPNDGDADLTFSPAANADTNRWTVAASKDTSHTLMAYIRSECACDFASNVTVTITGGGAESYNDDGFTKGVKTFSGTGSIKFKPDFTGMQGDQQVEIRVEDKDGGYLSRTWFFTVAASKVLETMPNGPVAPADALSQNYAGAAGRGAGHIYVATDSPSISGYIASWNCGNNTKVNAMAWGYKILKPEDNGTLDGGKDYKIDTSGNLTTGTTYYNYKTQFLPCGGTKDSYLYGWLTGQSGTTESTSGSTTTTMGTTVYTATLAPEEAGAGVGVRSVSLPTEKNDDGIYATTELEAIFALEYREADNCGDLNQDGIPDLMVRRYGLSSYDPETQTLTADYKSDNEDKSYNEDADYLPGKTTTGNLLTPNASNNWKSVGGAFTAIREIRGFHEGLNARYPNADDTYPDRDFSIYEEMAFRTWFNEQGHPGTADAIPVHNAGTALAGLTEAQSNALTTAWLAGGWSPENPTNPTANDTDEDGLADGYEYWFWYGAKVGYADKDGVWQGRMTGTKFNEDDIENPITIASDDIARVFDPNSWDSVTERDFDNDGLFDTEEYLLGTNPVQCDTDGDGMIDGWEVLRGLNPCADEEVNPSQTNPDGDFMADAPLYTTVIENGRETTKRMAPTFVTWETEDGTTNICVTTDGLLEDSVVTNGTAFYGVKIGEGAVTRDDLFFSLNTGAGAYKIPKTRNLVRSTIVIPADAKNIEVDSSDLHGNYHLIHDQVYAYYGFNPRTAWYENKNGYVHSRWDVPPTYGKAGAAVNTREFYTLDEYKLFKYRKATGIGVDGKTLMARLSGGTTNPSLPYSETYGDSEQGYASTAHGADTDSDGRPDGWELYVGAKYTECDNPLTKKWTSDIAFTPNSTLNGTEDIDSAQDNDNLAGALEFAGTDSIIAYLGCPSIAALSGKVWANKFWPTDPWDPDTDADGITDGNEGTSWISSVTFGRSSYLLQHFTMNYSPVNPVASNSVDGTTTCFRGGGMNPTTVDTDRDGLPDGWEMQFAGVAVDSSGNVLFGNQAKIYSMQMRIADGLFTDDNTIVKATTNDVVAVALGNYLVGGMDATWAGDAWTSASLDPRTGTIRDVDFDGDGLQNYQEYMTQALRVFRYDDAETPLNGRVILWPGLSFIEASMMPQPKATVSDIAEDYDFPAHDFIGDEMAWMAFTNSALYATYAGAVHNVLATNALSPSVCANIHGTTSTQYSWNWRNLGYLALPPHAWDPLALLPDGLNNCVWGEEHGYRIMLPPSSLRYVVTNALDNTLYQVRVTGRKYVSTNPRMWDSDNDGLDDYYELYHGMNPLYGADQNETGGYDLINDGYSGSLYVSAVNNAWNGWDGESMMPVGPIYDFTRYPWFSGAPDADPDGDTFRNADEMIAGNLTSPTTYHTDPTPLWMTDPTALFSYTRQSYAYPTPPEPYDYQSGFSIISSYPWQPGADALESLGGATEGNEAATYLWSFERNEGFDTDGDWASDPVEKTKNTLAVSDPQDFMNPARRNAVNFGGAGALYQAMPNHISHSGAYDMFRQFTIECWVKPETNDGERVILERGALYPAATDLAPSNAEHWRANFRLYLDGDVPVAMYDTDAAVPSGSNNPTCCAKVRGRPIATNAWSHIAVTYDGTEIAILVNGKDRAVTESALIPANGIAAIKQDPQSTNSYPSASYRVYDGALVIGARHADQAGMLDFTLSPDDQGSLAAYLQDFFIGSVAEVRIWDGARDEADIIADMAKAYTTEDVDDNRETVYDAWADGRLRNDAAAEATGKAVLPAQLMMHYNFTSLPGATKTNDVQQMLVGFTNYTAKTLAYQAPEWWSLSKWHSTVYADYRIIPWVQNTVAHLPFMDGSFADSQYWSADHAAYITSASAGYTDYDIPNTANPYGMRSFGYELGNRVRKATRLAEYDAIYADATMRHTFELRSTIIGFSDLVPVGDAWARRDADYWDGEGPMTAWVDTGDDEDSDGLPDWWEALQGADVSPADPVNETVAGASVLTYGELYRIQVARGMLPDGTIDPAYADTADLDSDGMYDWWEELYGIQGNSTDDADVDADNDGLSNYYEFLISFGKSPYGVNWDDMDKGFPLLSPRNDRSLVGQQVTDYYLCIPDEVVDGVHFSKGEYLGEVMTDHDYMEDWWENQYNVDYSNTGAYDPLKDADGDGWDNYAECRAALWGGLYSADMIDRWMDSTIQSLCYPKPAIGLKITYNGVQDLAGKGLVVRTITGNSRADATFVVDGSSVGIDGTYTDHIMGGYYDETTLRGFMSPGNVLPGQAQFYRAVMSSDVVYNWRYWGVLEDGWTWGWIYKSGTFSEYRKARRAYGLVELLDTEIDWEYVGRTISDVEGHYGTILSMSTNSTSVVELGTVDFRTGEYAFDLKQFAQVEPELENNIFKVTYTYKIGENWPQTVWLSEATKGWIKQGSNTIEAFIDLDGDGAYTAGEPFGIVKNVNVGWHKTGEVTLELFDTSARVPRLFFTQGTDDRTVNLGQGAQISYASDAQSEAGLTRTIRIVRDAINNDQNVPNRTVMSHQYVTDDRAFIHEGDVLGTGKYDLDWKYLNRDATKQGIKSIDSVTYRVEETVTATNGDQTVNLIARFTNNYEPTRTRAVCVSPLANAPVYSAQPTFVWSCADETMSAFRLEVRDSATSNLVFNSGIQLLPGRASSTVGSSDYHWTAPIYAGTFVKNGSDDTVSDVILETGKSYEWRVTLLNAKYSDDTTGFSNWTPFQMDIDNINRYPKMITGYGNVTATIRYFGANENVPSNMIRVAAYENADFTGDPVAMMHLADTNALRSRADLAVKNVFLGGVQPGTVYLMAFVDKNNNGKRDDSESWGYANGVGTGVEAIFNPVGVTVGTSSAALANPERVTIFIEDTDVNKNEIPDCIDEHLTDDDDATLATDSDADGVSDDDENAGETNTYKWDSDGDGMPDGFELWNEYTDATFSDADEVANQGDWMAYAEVTMTKITLADADSTSFLVDGTPIPQVGYAASNYTCFAMYEYGDVAGLGQQVKADNKILTNLVTLVEENVTVALVHSQVYDRYGFETGVCQPTNSALSVHTKAFTALDKYLLIRHLDALGLIAYATDKYENGEDYVNHTGKWSQYALKPGDPDNDRDGILDGWELYTMFGAKTKTVANETISPWNYADARATSPSGEAADFRLIDEWNDGDYPTDPWAKATYHGLSDNIAFKYDLKGDNQLLDPDHDGLSNLSEYRAAENGTFGAFSTAKGFTVADAFDYFRTNGMTGAAKRYAGFAVTDHDFIEDTFEDGQGVAVANRNVYDAHSDKDGNGWSLWSDARAYAATEGIVTEEEYSDGTNTYVVATTNHYAGVPQPKISLKVYGDYAVSSSTSYDETTSNTVTVTGSLKLKAYRNEDAALTEPYWTATVEGTVVGDHLEATIDGDGLVEGATVFVLEKIGDEGIAETTAFAKATVGFDRIDLVMTLPETSAVLPASTSTYGGEVYIRRGTIYGYEAPRIVWYGTAEDYLRDVDVLTRGTNAGTNNVFDLDWQYLVEDAAKVDLGNGSVGLPQKYIARVTYDVIYAEQGASTVIDSFTKFDLPRDGSLPLRPVATLVSPTTNSAFTVRTAQPTFVFTDLEDATAFRLDIATATNDAAVVWSVTNLLPNVKTARGYEYTAPVTVGGDVLKDGRQYFWRVSALNAKWSTISTTNIYEVTQEGATGYATNLVYDASRDWSAWGTFTTAIDSTDGDTGYGKLKAEVRYYGAATNSATDVVVGVYASPDFANAPVAVKRLAETSFAKLSVQKDGDHYFEAETNAASKAVVTFDGLEPGAYYVMAFNDANGNGTRDYFESWGYLNKIGTEDDDTYTPVTLEVVSTKSCPPAGVVFLEDTDANDDQIPDCVQDAALFPALEVEPEPIVMPNYDWDWDGLGESDEVLYGTYEYDWSTDGDEFPDGYEVWAGMNPLSYDYGWTGDKKDVMAYAIIKANVYVFKNSKDPENSCSYAIMLPKGDTEALGLYKHLTAGKAYPTVGLYTEMMGGAWSDYEYGPVYMMGGDYHATENDEITEVYEDMEIMLMHHQVFSWFGFISGLATPDDLDNVRTIDGAKVGTRYFYPAEKYLVSSFFTDPDEKVALANGGTTNVITLSMTSPVTINTMNRDRTWGESTTCLNATRADYDYDGVPDGWELYVCQGYASEGLTISPWNPKDGWYQTTELVDETNYCNIVTNYYDAEGRAYDTNGNAIEPPCAVTNVVRIPAYWPPASETNVVSVTVTNDVFGLFYCDKNGNWQEATDETWTLTEWYNAGKNPSNPYDRHTFFADIEDKVARQYNIETAADQLADNDRDLLSNWDEYQAAEVKKYGAFDVNEAYTLGQPTFDYFRAVGSTYVGELLTDHDFIVDTWEDGFRAKAADNRYYATRDEYDAIRDGDNDGWSLYAESRAGTRPDAGVKLSLSSVASDGDYTVNEFPIPVVKTTVSYNSNDLFDYPLVVKAWKGDTVEGVPDAIWTNAGASVEAKVTYRFLGKNPNAPMTINLGPGSIAEGSVKLEVFDPYYRTVTDTYNSNGVLTASSSVTASFDTSKWSDFAWFDQPFEDKSDNFVVGGTVDYTTGNVMIPFDSDMLQNSEHEWNVSGSAGTQGTHVYELWDLPESYFRIQWRSKIVESGNTKTMYLSVSDESAGSQRCLGHLREGENTFVAFADVNGNGVWDADEPMGIARHVNVGWSSAEVSVQLTANTTGFERFFPDSIGNTTTVVSTTTTNSVVASSTTNTSVHVTTANGKQRVSIVRTSVTKKDGSDAGIRSRGVFAKKMDLDNRFLIAETDYVRDGEWDLDWKYLAEDAAEAGVALADVKSVTYDVYLGKDAETSVYTFRKDFDGSYSAPNVSGTLANGSYTLHAARPVLNWKASDGYTAFALEIATNADFAAGTVVYATTNFMPEAFADGCAFQPDCYVGDGLADKTTYYWHVQQLNAKFTTNVWSETASFVTAVDSSNHDTGYGALAADVRYFGPFADATADVVVGVYGSPDFSGAPVARRRLAIGDTHKFVDLGATFAEVVTNVTFDGIEPGSYYVMAFVDVNGNGTRDAYETWGYVNKLATTADDPFTPVALNVVATKANVESAFLVMEDTDVNRNGTLDCLEDMTGWEATVETPATSGSDDPDTDDDGIPDGWEVFNDLDPLDAADAARADTGDLMACYDFENATFVKVGTDSAHATWYALLDPDNEPANLADAGVPNQIAATKLVSAASVYCYGSDADYVYALGQHKTFTAADGVVLGYTNGTLRIVHAQVYAQFGFNANTVNPSAYLAGEGVNTKPFTALDKYLVVRYLAAIGATDADEATLFATTGHDEMIWRFWKQGRAGTVAGDADADGVADGWELYTMFGTRDLTAFVTKTPATAVGADATAKISPYNTYDGLYASPAFVGFTNRVTAASDKVLRLVDEYDGGYKPTDPWSVDTDGDGVIDYYAYYYHLKGGDGKKDLDGDGLSNYAEYLINEVFDYEPKLDVTKAKTADGILDYFRKLGSLYLGEIFTDHDQVSDDWEVTYAAAASRAVYDAVRDDDSDGWSNYAEAKVGTDPRYQVSMGADGTMPEYPVPTIEATVVYNGGDPILKPVVFKAWSEKTEAGRLMNTAPDAIWTTGSADTTVTNTPKYLGKNPKSVYTQYLGPGAVVPNSVQLQFRNPDWYYVSLDAAGAPTRTRSADSPSSAWYTIFEDDGFGSLVTSAVTNGATLVKVGTIDYTSGKITIDFTKAALNGNAYVNKATGMPTFRNDENAVCLDLATSYVKLTWLRQRIGTAIAGTYYLSDADAVATDDDEDTVKSGGFVKEGKNTFIAYVADDEGNYVPGEPFGYVAGVDVGWSGAKFTIELTKTHAITPRMKIWSDATGSSSASSTESTDDDTSDRGVTIDGVRKVLLADRTLPTDSVEEEDIARCNAVSNALVVTAPTDPEVRLRVVRFGLNGYYAYLTEAGIAHGHQYSEKGPRVVIDRTFTNYGRDYLCEGDFLQDGEFDIDWTYLKDEVIDSRNVDEVASGITNVTYLVVLEGGTGFEYWIRRYDEVGTTINTLGVTVERRFELCKSTPVAESQNYVYGARPTFTWSVPDEEPWAKAYGSSYTAFNIMIVDSDATTKVKKIWESGITRAPAIKDGKFTWTAPICADDLIAAGKKLNASGNYRWCVAMYNAKFKPTGKMATDNFSNEATFSMAANAFAPMNDQGYSSIDVSVKYTGATNVLAKAQDISTLQGKVRVQAFTTPDAAGEPVAATIVTNATSIANAADLTPNARLVGLPVEGTYYIRAFIDLNGNKTCDDWESYGFASTAVTLDANTTAVPQVGLFIEDADTDKDEIPDAYEYAVAGWTDDFADVADSMSAYVATTGKLLLSATVEQGLATSVAGLSSSQYGVSVTKFQNPYFAAAVFGSYLGASPVSLSYADICAAVAKNTKILENTLKITAFTFDADPGTKTAQVKLYVDAEIQTQTAGRELAQIYDVATDKITVTVKVYRRKSLAATDDWETEPVAVATKDIGKDEAEVTFDLTNIDAAGFYKVEVVQ